MFSLGNIFLFIMMFLVVFLAKTLGQKLTEKTEKLEAVKDWHKTQVKDYSYIRDSYQGKTRTHAGTVLKNLERLGEILEAEDDE